MTLQEILDTPIEHNKLGAARYSCHQIHEACAVGIETATKASDVKLRASLDSCLVAATIAEESGFTQNAKAIRAVVSHIERTME